MGAFARLGNELYSGRRSIDFVGRRMLWYAISLVIVVIAIVGVSVRGLDMGIEFVGGAEYRVTTDGSVDQAMADRLREAVAGTGVHAAESPVVNTSGEHSVIVQTEPVNEHESQQVKDAITGVVGTSTEISQTEIGASWGAEVAKRALIGLIVFLVLVVLFIWAYFREWKMSVAAVVALAHDLVITIGVYALSGFEVTPATVTGLLTILGFSLYDTVVVFDKVRENTRNLRHSRMTYAEAANLAVNQTLVRSVNTSIVALIPVGAILYVGAVQLGSGSLKDLALALFVGMAAGAYSSIFIATPLLAQLKAGEKEVQEQQRRAKARRRHDADRYADVPSGGDGREASTGSRRTTPSGRTRPVSSERPDAEQAPRTGSASTSSGSSVTGTGRANRGGTVSRSTAAGRNQPSRQTRSQRSRNQRGKKK